MKKWVSSIAATVIAGVLVFWFTQGIRDKGRAPVVTPEIEISPKVKESLSPEEWYRKGLELWDGKRYSNPALAVEYFSRAARLDPVNANTYGSRGLAYINLGQYVAAIEDLGKAINLYPDEETYYTNRGFAYCELGKFYNAKKDWEKACRMGSVNACDNLATIPNWIR